MRPQDVYEGSVGADRSILRIGGAGEDVPPQKALEFYGSAPMEIGGVAKIKTLKDRNRSYENGWHLLNHRLLKIGAVMGVRVIAHNTNSYIGLRKPLSIGRVSFERSLQVKNGIYPYQLLRFGYPLAAYTLEQGLWQEFRQLLRMAAAGPVHNSTATTQLKQDGGTRVLRFAMHAPKKLYHGNYARPIIPPPTDPRLPKYENVPHRHMVRMGRIPDIADLIPKDAPKVRRALRIGTTGNINNDAQLEQKTIVPLPPDYQKTGKRPDVLKTGRIMYNQQLEDKHKSWELSTHPVWKI